MKARFILLTFLLLCARGCDLYSTSLWFFDNPFDETNPLTQIFGFGWTGLVLTNLIIVGLTIYGFYYYSFKYSTQKFKNRPSNLLDFVSELYFNEKGKFYQIFYKIPKNKKVLFGHTGYVLIRVLIIASFLATIHNLCQFYDVPIYNTFSETVERPLFIVYGLIILSYMYFTYRIWKSEYLLGWRNFNLNRPDYE